jgi:hypothetical protein
MTDRPCRVRHIREALGLRIDVVRCLATASRSRGTHLGAVTCVISLLAELLRELDDDQWSSLEN